MPRRKKQDDYEKPKKKKINYLDALELLFRKNEEVEKKYTDEQLREILLEYYPEKRKLTVLKPTRIAQYRQEYNKGKGNFKNRPPAGTEERPFSYGYNEDGTVRGRGRIKGSKNSINCRQQRAKRQREAYRKKRRNQKIKKAIIGKKKKKK